MTDEQPVQPLTDQEITAAEAVVSDLLKKLEVDAPTTVTQEGDIVSIVIDTQDNGMLIGYHGEILEALQLISSLLIAKKIGRFIRITVEVGDYRKNRSAYLEKLAEQIKERVLTEGREQSLPELKSWERRVIHMILQDDKEVVSESVGEGRDRVLVIKPRS